MLSLRSLFGRDAGVLRDQNFQLLLIANLVGPLGVSLLSPALDSLVGPFGTSPARIGLIVSFFTAPSILMIPIAGVLADRYSRKRVLVTALLSFGVAGSAIALTTEFRVVLALRTVQGIAFGGLTPVIITSIGDMYTGTAETTAQGLRFTGSGISLTVFPLVAGVLVGVAWQYPFLIHLVAIPIAVAMFVRFEEPSQSPQRVTDGGETVSYRRELFRLVTTRRVLALVIARGLGTVVWTGFLTYNSTVVVQVIGGTPQQAGVLVALASASFAGAASQAGRLSALFDSRLFLLVAANICLGAGFSLTLFAPNLPVASTSAVLLGAGFGVALSIYRSLITGLAPAALRGGLVSASEGAGRIMDTTTPIAMGGIIAVATPVVGFAPAVQISGLAAAVVGAGGGSLCLVLASVSREVPVEETGSVAE